MANIRRPQRTAPPAEALEHLRRDPVMRGVIERVGTLEVAIEPDLWWSLIDSIISQQVSVQAAASIIGRVAALGANGRPTPAEVAAMDDELLRAAGLSRAKVRYVKDLAAHFLDGSLRPADLAALSDDEVIAALTRVKGIGRWTAEMILIFTLGRPDVLPVDDLGVRAAAQRLYDLPARPGKDELLRIAEPWRPWRSLASRYLWRSGANTPAIAAPAPGVLADPAPSTAASTAVLRSTGRGAKRSASPRGGSTSRSAKATAASVPRAAMKPAGAPESTDEPSSSPAAKTKRGGTRRPANGSRGE